MIGTLDIRNLLADLGPDAFVSWLHEGLGLGYDDYGNDHIDLASRKLRPEEFSLRALAVGLCGEQWYESCNPAMAARFARGRPLLEAGPGIDPTAFQNISNWNRVIGGIISAKFLEQYQLLNDETEQFVTLQPSEMTSEKMGGIGGAGDVSEERKPGMRHVDVGLSERWITTPETKEYALKIQVLKETVFFNRGPDVLREAANSGRWVALRKRKRILDMVLGITGVYSYMGTDYATFLTTGLYINNLSNPLVDWHSFDLSLQTFAGLTDPTGTNEPIEVQPTTILVMPYKRMTASAIFGAEEVETRNAGNTSIFRFANPVGRNLNVVSSVYAYSRLIAADGGNLAAAAAREYWYAGDPKMAFGYLQNWPLTTLTANPSDFDMIDKGIAAAYFFNERGTPFVMDPRYWQKNTN
jgi:hypothetical protein